MRRRHRRAAARDRLSVLLACRAAPASGIADAALVGAVPAALGAGAVAWLVHDV